MPANPIDLLLLSYRHEVLGLLLRPEVTLPVEIYSDDRVAEFDEAEAELGQSSSRADRGV
jgi:hypothetical protein